MIELPVPRHPVASMLPISSVIASSVNQPVKAGRVMVIDDSNGDSFAKKITIRLGNILLFEISSINTAPDYIAATIACDTYTAMISILISEVGDVLQA